MPGGATDPDLELSIHRNRAGNSTHVKDGIDPPMDYNIIKEVADPDLKPGTHPIIAGNSGQKTDLPCEYATDAVDRPNLSANYNTLQARETVHPHPHTWRRVPPGHPLVLKQPAHAQSVTHSH